MSAAASIRSDNLLTFYLLALALVFAPLFWGGNDPLPLLVLELAALGLAGGILWRPACQQDLSWPALTALGLLVLAPLAQLVPAPLSLWTELPGRAFYAQGWSQIPDNPAAAGWRAIAIVPFATESAWLALLPPVMVFLAAVGLTAARLRKLAAVLLVLAVFEALLGIIQVWDGPDSVFRLGNIYYKHSAVGTYINRNHLAGLLEMALPVALALLAGAVGFNGGHSSSQSKDQSTLRNRLAELTTARMQRAIGFGAAAVAILAGLLLTGSRAGIAMGVVAVLLCLVAFPRQKKTITALVLTALALAALTGLEHVASRFLEHDLLRDGRWPFFRGAVESIREFFPLGSGGGAFEAVYHRFYPDVGKTGILEHAHNDYLEGIAEHGLAAIMLLALLLGLYLRRWPAVWRQRSRSTFGGLQAGAGFALLLMALHSLLDFNLHIPANAVIVAFLAAVFFHNPTGADRRHYRRRRTGAAATAEPAPAQPPQPQERVIPPENLINPFNE